MGSSVDLKIRLAGQHVAPHLRKVGQRLGGGADVFDLDVWDPEADDRARGGHPVISVGLPDSTVHLLRGDDQAVVGFLALPADAVDLCAQRGEPVGFVAAQVCDAAQL